MKGMKDLIIIGGGPAGLAAGIYAGRAKLDVLMLEKGVFGGLAASTENIENYPGFSEGIDGPELMARMQSQAQGFGMKIKTDEAEKINFNNGYFEVQTKDDVYHSWTVILATGAEPKTLNVPGEEKFTGRGVSYCATCDGALYREKRVLVVGGGDAAIEGAIFLTRFASKVIVIHRRQELRATSITQQRALKNARIEFFLNSVIEEILGNSFVEGVRVKNVRTGETRHIKVDGIFIYIGHKPASKLVEVLAKRDAEGYLITDEKMQTSCPGLFAAGDVRQKFLRQIVTAVSDGAIAAVAAEKHIKDAVGQES